MYLHVLCSNESALEFYKSNGFVIKEKLENYYTDLDPPHCFILEKHLEPLKIEQIPKNKTKKWTELLC